ncbi:MAG TPA: hypothetical protein DCL54_16325, partial [Alphaproteobacteria bacterium]|nr:hypothetical protein [Alphaproteobacteria bacterium]
MRRQIILSLSALALASTAAQAREERWYVSLEAGASFAQDADFDFGPIGGPVAGNGTAELETGWAGMAALGYAWPKNWRAEFELGYRNNDLDRVCIPGCAAVPGGSVEAFSQMFNVIYDFDIAQDWYLSLGAGIGGNYVTIEGAGASDNDYALAGQLLAGINYEISDRLDLSLNYRYMYVGDLEFSNAGLGLFADVDGLDYHAVTVGLRWDLHPKTVETVVVVKDPVPPAKQYIVFFGFNKFNLTAEAQGVVAEAASAAKAQGTANI